MLLDITLLHAIAFGLLVAVASITLAVVKLKLHGSEQAHG